MPSKALLEYIFRGTDCTFIFPENDNKCKEIHANRYVIDCVSNLLKSKFETYKRSTLIIQDVKYSAFKMVLEHVYTGYFPETISQEELFELYDAASKYEFKETLNCVIRRIIRECKLEKLDELLAYLNFALKNYIIEIQNFLQELIESDADLLFMSDNFLKAHPRVLNWIFSLNDLNTNEWTLIDIIERYKEYHLAAGRHGISSQIQPAINNIRFLSMSVAQIHKTPFLSVEEKKSLIQVINQEASDKCLPMYFSRRRIGRCYKSIIVTCQDAHLKRLYDENKIKMCTFKEKKYFADGDGKIVASIENSGLIVPFTYQEFTPIKTEISAGRAKKACTGIQQNVLYYRENKQIMVNKKYDHSEKDKNEDETMIYFQKMSLKK